MDLALYGELFRRYWLVFLGVVFVAIAGGLFATLRQPISYEGSVFLAIAQRPEVNSTSMQYGDYYHIQTSSLLATQLSSWLTEPATVEDALQKIGVDSSSYSLKKLSQVLQAKAQGGTGIQLSYASQNPEQTKSVLEVGKEITATKLSIMQQQGFYPGVGILSGDVVVRESSRNIPLTVVLSAVAGMVLGFILLLILSLGLPERTIARR